MEAFKGTGITHFPLLAIKRAKISVFKSMEFRKC